MEKFKQKAFVLQELLEFKRDAVGDPARRINSLMKVCFVLLKSVLMLNLVCKGYTSLERSIEDVTRSLSHHADGPSRSGTQEAEVRMRLVVQRAEAQLANEKRMRRELEERLFRSEVMSMKLNELLSGRDVNWIDANVLWANCLRDQVPSSEYVKKEQESKKFLIFSFADMLVGSKRK